MSSSAWFAPWPRCCVEGRLSGCVLGATKATYDRCGVRGVSDQANTVLVPERKGRAIVEAVLHIHCRNQMSTYTAEVSTNLDYLVRGPHQLTDTERQLTVRALFKFVLAVLVHRAPSLFLLGFPQVDAETLDVSICSRSDKEA